MHFLNNYWEINMMKRYLNPKADLVFKRIFGEHADILKSFLNAMLPLPKGREIKELSYLPAEQVPKNPAFKNMIADVKCKDEQGNIFIVEMQTQWIGNFYKRLVFGASRAYVNQLRPSKSYDNLLPVLALGILDDVVRKDTNEWYHHYRFTDVTDIEQKNTLDHLQLLLIELPKFKPQSRDDKKMQVLWLRFLSEISGEIENVPEELLAVPEIKTALTLSEEAGYTLSQLDAYESYLDAVRVQKEIDQHNEERKKALDQYQEECEQRQEERKKAIDQHQEECEQRQEERKKAIDQHQEECEQRQEERKKAIDQHQEECKKEAEKIAKEIKQKANELEQKTNEVNKQAAAVDKQAAEVKKRIEEIEESKKEIEESKKKIAKTKAEAEKNAKLEIAQKLIRKNAAPNIIASVTGLPMREIKQLADLDGESAMV